MRVLLLVAWIYNGELHQERWWFPTMEECLKTATAVDMRVTKMVTCVKADRVNKE